MRLIGLILVLAGVGGVYNTYKEWRVGSSATGPARAVTFAQLVS